MKHPQKIISPAKIIKLSKPIEADYNSPAVVAINELQIPKSSKSRPMSNNVGTVMRETSASINSMTSIVNELKQSRSQSRQRTELDEN